jgi:hypothetical protein
MILRSNTFLSPSHLAAGLLPLAAGLLLAGCSKGSGYTAVAGTSPATAVAGVSTADVQRDPGGYDWGQAVVSSDSLARVQALGVTPVGTDAWAAVSPRREVVELTTGDVEALPFDGQGFLASNGELFLATGDAPGAGDVYQRTPTGWRQTLDGDHDRLVLAEQLGRVLAFAGAAGNDAIAYRLDAGAGTWERLGLGAYVPTAAATAFGEVWVGAGPAAAEGPASLRRGGWMGFAEVSLQSFQAVAGERQEVTALQTVPRGVVVAVSSFDAVSGQALRGQVSLLVPGEPERLLADYTAGEAPLALAFQDETLYVGTSTGRLQYLDGQGRMIDEQLSVAVDAIDSLASPNRLTLLVGCRTSQGAQVLTRVARTLTAATPGGATTAGPGWAQVKAAMISCAGCHSTMTTGWMVSSGLADDMADYQATLPHVDTASPATSALLEKGSGGVTHAGGALWASGSSDYQTVLAWIQGGAPFDPPAGTTATTTGTTTGGATPAPPANTSNPDYVNDMKVLLSGCVACHSTMTTGYSLSAGLANDMADHQATLGQVDLGNPTASVLLAKTNGAAAHAGGAAWPVGSAQYQTALAWIQGGAPFQIAGRTPATPTIPSKPTYVVDVKPVIASCVVCHDGTRTDDMLLSKGLVDDARDYRSVLDEVNLGTPTASKILREPTGREHPKIFDQGSLPYQILLKWVETGATFN